MAEVYTAQEMRDKATELQERADEILRDAVEEGGCTYKPLCKADAREIETIANMLRQAADAKERDEKRGREAGADAAQICGEVGEMVGREAACRQPVTDCHGLAELREENARLRAALKPVLECKVLSAMTAEAGKDKSDYCSNIIFKAQRIYNEWQREKKKVK